LSYSFVHFDLDDDYVIAEITDGQRSWLIGAEVDFTPDAMILSRLDMQGDGPNKTGLSALRRMAQWMKVEFNVRQLRIEGAPRTSGAGPGRLPPPLVF
jgi:hypothetical protein